MGGEHHTSSASASDGSPTAEAMPSAWSSASRSSDMSRALSLALSLYARRRRCVLGRRGAGTAHERT